MKCTLIEKLLNEYGVAEKVGAGSNPRIIEYYNYLKINPNDDDIAWCSLFANFISKKASCTFTNQLNARSWLTVGREVKKPDMGDVVIFWREKIDSWQGHVAFFIREDGDDVWVLGGNQDNQVSIAKYPKSRVLGYRDITQKAPEIPVAPLKDLKKGDKGDAVKQLQKMLGITADGDFGPVTERVLKDFQKIHKLPITGVTDLAIIKSIIKQ